MCRQHTLYRAIAKEFNRVFNNIVIGNSPEDYEILIGIGYLKSIFHIIKHIDNNIITDIHQSELFRKVKIE